MQIDSQIIGAVIGSIATIFAALLTIFFRPESFITVGFRLRGKKRLSWSSIEQGLTKIMNELESVGFTPDLIITVAGSGGMMANWLYKSRNRTIPTYTTLQEPKNNRWAITPTRHSSIEGNRWIIHIPDYVNDIAQNKKVLILDSGYATGETALAIRSYLQDQSIENVKYACLVYVKNVGPQTIKPDFWAYEFDSSNFWYPWGKAS